MYKIHSGMIVDSIRQPSRHVESLDTDPSVRAGHRALGVLNQELGERDFLVGGAFSVADICLYGYVHTAQEGGFDLDRFPAVCAWLARVAALPKHIPQ